MMTHGLKTIDDSLFNAMGDRCQSLGLALWQCDGAGVLDPEPAAPESTRRWLGAPVLREGLEQRTRAWAEERDAECTQLYEGCWLIPFFASDDSRRQDRMIAMALGSASVQGPAFEAICASGGVEPDEARLGLAPLLKRDSPDIEELAMVLDWSRQDLAQSSIHSQTIDEFTEKLVESYEQSHLLFNLARFINRGSYESVSMACRQLQQILPFDWVAAGFGRLSKVRILARRTLVEGDLPCPKEAFDSLVTDLIEQMNGGLKSHAHLLPRGAGSLPALVGSEVVAETIIQDNKVVGILLAGNKGGPDADICSTETQLLEAAAGYLGVFHENIAHDQEQRTMFLGTLQAVSSAIDAKDRYTRGHSDWVSHLSARLAAALDLGPKRVEEVRIAGLVHDVGKIGVPESVLCKNGRLTDEEFELMKRHPVIGYEILKDIPPMTAMFPGVLYHHERWDGRGYPEGLKAEEIPFYGRILACADAFDAMSTTRSYRSVLPRDEVLVEMRRCSGTQFDPAMVPVFSRLDFSNYDRLVIRHDGLSGTDMAA